MLSDWHFACWSWQFTLIANHSFFFVIFTRNSSKPNRINFWVFLLNLNFELVLAQFELDTSPELKFVIKKSTCQSLLRNSVFIKIDPAQKWVKGKPDETVRFGWKSLRPGWILHNFRWILNEIYSNLKVATFANFWVGSVLLKATLRVKSILFWSSVETL